MRYLVSVMGLLGSVDLEHHPRTVFTPVGLEGRSALGLQGVVHATRQSHPAGPRQVTQQGPAVGPFGSLGSKHPFRQTAGQPGVVFAALPDGNVIDELGHQDECGRALRTVTRYQIAATCFSWNETRRRDSISWRPRRAFPRGPADPASRRACRVPARTVEPSRCPARTVRHPRTAG